MAGDRLTHTARADIVSILAGSNERFGEEARRRDEALIATAIHDAASRTQPDRRRARAPGDQVHRPRPFLLCRRDGETLVIGRVLPDAMELRRHVDQRRTWE